MNFVVTIALAAILWSILDSSLDNGVDLLRLHSSSNALILGLGLVEELKD